MLNLHNNTALTVDIPPALERPDSGSFVFAFSIITRNDANALVDADSTPTVTVANQAGNDRSSHLSSVSHAGTGEYTISYTMAASDAIEELRFRVAATIATRAQLAVRSVQVVDTTAVDFTASDRATLTAIAANTDVATSTRAAQTTADAIKSKTDNLPATFPALGSDGKVLLSGTTHTAAVIPTVSDLTNPPAALVTVGDLLHADRVIDTSVTPWALVLIKQRSGSLGQPGAIELLRQRLYDVTGGPIANVNTVLGQSIT